MQRIQSALRPDTPVRLTGEQDTLCRHCPNRDAPCPGARRYDRAVLERCGLSFGQEFRWAELQRLLELQILARGTLDDVCGDCQWAPLCRKANASR